MSDRRHYLLKNNNRRFSEVDINSEVIKQITITLKESEELIVKIREKRYKFMRDFGKKPEKIILGPKQMLKLKCYSEISNFNRLYQDNLSNNMYVIFGMQIISMDTNGIAFEVGDDYMRHYKE